EAELFGHEKGAFTDAKAARAGLFETAHGGTILLDEIGHISPSLQSKFLKVIEEKAVRRIGATTQRRIDVQVIAATSRDLEAATTSRTPACPSRPWSARSSSRRWRRPAATRARPPGCSASRATRSAIGS